MRLTIDASVAGADIRQTVMAFPLLLRFTATNFDFSEARGDGADIRFVDTAGKNLPYEIERWDAQREFADVWVLVPRIEARSKDNWITMYWGNRLASPVGSGSDVFGDFACAMHMVSASDGIASQLEDSSGRGNSGIMQEPALPITIDQGVSGPGLALDGNGSYLATSTRMMSPDTFSVSAWLKTTGNARSGIAGFASKSTGSATPFDRTIWMDENGRIAFGVLHGNSLSTISSLTSYNDGAWHHVLARLGASGQYLFVDGESIADDPASTGADSYYGYWRFGEELSAPAPSNNATVPASNFFVGILDELRITISERNDAWIKLAYATQRPDSTVVSYQRLP